MFKIKKKQMEDISALVGLALKYHQAGNLREAETVYRTALKKQPGSFDVLHMMGVLYAQMKDEDLAVRYLEKALKIGPDSAYAHYNLGNLFRDGGRFDKAASCYRSILELHQNDEQIFSGLHVTLRDNAPLDDLVMNYQSTSDRTILISVPAYNRGKITRLSLGQTMRCKTSNCRLQVYHDHSTEYDDAFLAPYADEVIRLAVKKGIHALRWYQFRRFLETDFDFLYMTDSDVIHDPRFVTVLEVLYETGEGKLPVCLFNSAFHMEPRSIFHRRNGILLKETAPGVSMFYDRNMVVKIVTALDDRGETSSWDYTAVQYLGLPWITPETSYLEHYGGGGIHNADYERDRAISPTRYLRERREAILGYLMRDVALPSDLSGEGASLCEKGKEGM